METIILFALIVVCARLWYRAGVLETRLTALELDLIAPRPEPKKWPVAPVPARAEPIVPESLAAPLPLPEPIAAIAEPVAPVAKPMPVPPPAPERTDRPIRSFSFEDIFGRYLPIWAGGVTLAVAGFLIVKYSIDAGLLSPLVRVICGLLFGSGLIAAAEVALRSDAQVRDDRIRQSLAGAGIATLYASILVAANLYHLIDPMTAFVGLAAITALAALLSLRFGAPSAVLGLVGGLAAPALVGAESPNVPLLATYLALTVGGLCVLGRAQRWWWLGALAVTGGLGWGLLLIVGGLYGAAAILSVGVLTLILAIAFPLLLSGTQARTFQLVSALAGCAQIAAIVGLGGFGDLEWGLFALISAAILWLSRREPYFADVPAIGLGTGIMLAVAWPAPNPTALALVLGSGATIYGLPALWRLWRAEGRLGDAGQIAAIAFAVSLVPISHYWFEAARENFVPLALLGATIAAAAAALGWRNAARTTEARFATLAVTAVTLILLAAGLALPVWALAPATAVAALATLLLAKASTDPRIERAGHAFGLAAILLLPGANGMDEMQRAIGLPGIVDTVPATLRWLTPALAALGFARWSSNRTLRQLAQAIGILFGYIAAAQIVPQPWLALVPAATIAALAATGKRAPLPALGTAGLLSAGWALLPLGIWLTGATGALAGIPFYVSNLPALSDVAIRIVAPGLGLVLILWRGSLPARERQIGAIATITLATIALHTLWKHVFAINDVDGFIDHGMAERTLWEALLIATALLGWRAGARRTATGLGLAGLLHFAWFTLLVHNPLWAPQDAGPWLVPAYATAFFAIWWSSRIVAGATADRARDWARIALILMLAASLLRQAFHGSLFTYGVTTQAEDISRSLLAILLAIGFLQWGIRRGLIDWRIASLVLMLGAVGKVFLFDAAGLDGLLRIASFAALGFSLIGMGWLYSRYLPARPLTDESDPTDTVATDRG
jgi:uncharacterized membrane protein